MKRSYDFSGAVKNPYARAQHTPDNSRPSPSLATGQEEELERQRDELLDALDEDHSHEGGLPRPDCRVCALLRKHGRAE